MDDKVPLPWNERPQGYEMIKYQLMCEKEHEFEGWFQNSDAFSEQCADGLVSCPICETVKVRRAPMAPNLASPKTRKTEIEAERPAEVASSPQVLVSGAEMPPEVMVKMREFVVEMRALHTRIKDECRDVGENFAEEARKIHYGEAEPEGIYGEVSDIERDQLDEEGIEIMQMPWLPQDN